MKHFVEIIYPGLLHCSSSIEEVKERNPKLIKVPIGAEGFRFFDENEQKERINYSGFYYLGEKFTMEEVESLSLDESKDRLVKNMKRNDWSHLVKTKNGSWYPFREDDKII